MEPFAGHPLKEQMLRLGEVITTSWKVKAEYAWDAGFALSRFLEGLKEGKILATECPECRRVLVPPRAFCELCFRPLSAWREVKDTGTINTFSVSFVNWDASRREVPEVPAVVDMDGASPGVGLVHLLGEVGETLEEVRARVRIGMKVRAVWKPKAQRKGAITDIRYFKPV